MYYIESLPNILELGNQMNNTTTFQIDMSSWISQYPDGTIYVIVERPDKFTYPSEVKRCRDLCEGILDWRVSNIDTFVAGYGLVQFRLIQDNDIMLSESVRSIVYKSAEPCTPDRMPQWLEAMIEASQVILDGQVINSDALAPEYNPNAIYPTAGVYCTSQGYLWELLVPITVAEPFTPSHWKKVDFLTSTRDYATLINKPSIDGFELVQGMTSDDLGLSKISALNAHILNQNVHVNALEKERWNQSITPDMLEGALGFYYKKTEIDTKLSEVNQTINSLSDDVVHDQDFNEVLGGINQQLANITRSISNLDVQKADKSSVTASINTINQSIAIISSNITTLSNTKADKSELPTKTSDLANDSGFITETTNDLTNYYLKTETYTKQEVNNLVAPKANKSELPTKTSDLANDSGFINSAVNNLTNYYPKSETYTKQEVSDFVNGLGFITNATNDLLNYYLKSEVYTKAEVEALIAQVQTVRFEEVTVLPTVGEPNVIYLVPSSQSSDTYEEWIYTNGDWKNIGSTQVDLSDYYTKEDVNGLLANKANQADLTSHVNNANVHVTTQEKSTWNGKASQADLNAHVSDTDVHVTTQEKSTWNGKASQTDLTNHIDNTDVHVTSQEKTTWNNKASQSDLSNHIADTNVHVNAQEKSTWNGKSKVGANPILVGTESDLVGIEIDGTKFKVPQGGSGGGVLSFNGRTGTVVPQSGDYTKAMVGLGNVDNTTDTDKPISTAQQTALNAKADDAQTFTEASTRTNIASGEHMSTLFGKIKKFFSDLKAVAFSGSYNDLSDKPTPYELPIASNQTLGGIKVGNNLTITQDGTLNATGGSGGDAIWGSILGTLSNQTDLQQALNAKEEKSIMLSQTAYANLVERGAVLQDVTYYVYADESDVVVVGNKAVFAQDVATVSGTKATLNIGSVSGTKLIV